MKLSAIINKIYKVYESITHTEQLRMANRYCHRLKHKVILSCNKDNPDYAFEKRSAIDLLGNLIVNLGNKTVHRMNDELTRQTKESETNGA